MDTREDISMNSLNENKILTEHVDTVFNLDIAAKIIRDTWESPDDYWYISILQRRKDNDQVVDDFGKSIFVSQSNRQKFDGGNERANAIGYAIISGRTMEEALNALYCPTVNIFPIWINTLGMGRVIKCGDNKIENIVRICDTLNARAYMNIYKKSYIENSSREPGTDLMTPVKIQQLRGKSDFDSKEKVFNFYSSRSNKPSAPFYLVDCDLEDNASQNKVVSILKKYGITPDYQYQTHNGCHFIFDIRKLNLGAKEAKHVLKNLKYEFESTFGVINPDAKVDAKGINKTQLSDVELEHDKKMILYSSVGRAGLNVRNPLWNAKRVYPNPELRRKVSEQTLRKIIRESLIKILNLE